MGIQPASLNRMKLRQFRVLFSSLDVPDPVYLPGIYRGFFVGPGWLRAWAGPALVLSGLGGWWGKKFYADGRVINIVQRGGKFDKVFPMNLARMDSYIDQQEGISIKYLPENPFPWMFIVDELRRMDEETLLGMSALDFRGLRRLAIPFILQKTKNGMIQEMLVTGPLPPLEK